jgi:hypothetical protein
MCLVKRMNMKLIIELIFFHLGRESLVRSSIVQREHEHSRSLEHSSQNNNNNSTVDKQSRSFDAVHLLKPNTHREDAMVNRRTKSYECADEPLPSVSPVAPAPIVIKIPDMRELVQAAHLSRLQKKESVTISSVKFLSLNHCLFFLEWLFTKFHS